MRLVLADDHPLFRLGLRLGLEARGIAVVGEAADGWEALRLCLELSPDVALLDLKMPGLDGLAAGRRLRSERPGVLVVLLTTFSEPALIESARLAGLHGFLPKELSLDQLVAALQELISNPAGARLPAQTLPRLSEREQQVLALLASGLSNKRIAAQLGVSPDTVKDHIASLYAKLGVGDRVQAVNKARDLGFLLDLPPG
jgi:DNA-binding NarL/FixJ family response regulator